MNPNVATGAYKVIWFMVNMYDDRYEFREKYHFIQADAETARPIYSIGFNTFNPPGTTLWDKEVHVVAGDLLPHVINAIEAAYDSGHYSTRDLADFKITTMSGGWEVGGLSICTMRIVDVSLKANY
jgi:hypothetical protein